MVSPSSPKPSPSSPIMVEVFQELETGRGRTVVPKSREVPSATAFGSCPQAPARLVPSIVKDRIGITGDCNRIF